MNLRYSSVAWLFLVPFIAFAIGALGMSFASGRGAALEDMEQRFAVLNQVSPTPLNQRFLGYSKVEANQYWDALGTDGRGAVETFLYLDMAFPFVYCGALLFSLIRLARLLELRALVPVSALLLLAVAISDWIENAVHLIQMDAFVANGPAAVAGGAIQVASLATIAKLAGVALAVILLIWLAGMATQRCRYAGRAVRPPV